MVKKKNEEKKEKTPQKKPIKEKEVVNIEKFSISELLEKFNIKPLNAVGFLNYYGLTEDFKKEFEKKEINATFSEGEFNDMYERYMRREI